MAFTKYLLATGRIVTGSTGETPSPDETHGILDGVLGDPRTQRVEINDGPHHVVDREPRTQTPPASVSDFDLPVLIEALRAKDIELTLEDLAAAKARLEQE